MTIHVHIALAAFAVFALVRILMLPSGAPDQR